MNSWKLKFLEVLVSNVVWLVYIKDVKHLLWSSLHAVEQFLTGLTEFVAKNIHLTNQNWLLNVTLRSVFQICGINMKYSCYFKSNLLSQIMKQIETTVN